MSARSLALFSLLAASAASAAPHATTLMIYVKSPAPESSTTIALMKRELGQIMQPAGYSLEWRDANAPPPPAGTPLLVVLDLRGDCSASRGTGNEGDPIRDLEPLASTAISEGRLLPFSSLNCDSLTRMLGPALAAEPAARKNWLYGRAMARVAAHELYHILGETRVHSKDGMAKPGFTVRDLLSERFEFEAASLGKLRQADANEEIVTGADAASGR